MTPVVEIDDDGRSEAARDYLFDISRLIWRIWSGRLPTGIDRVCLAYLERFAGRSLAVIQRKWRRFVLSAPDSDYLFEMLLGGPVGARPKLIRAVAKGILSSRRAPLRPGMIYLNVGHTGLDEPSLVDWIARHQIKAVYLIHDLIPITHPEFCRAGEGEKHRRRMLNVLSSATGVIGNSQATIDDLAAFAVEVHRPMPASVAAWLGVFAVTKPVRARTLDRPHLVAVGTIEGRKNHVLLLQIWQRLVRSLGDRAPILLVIGQRGWELGHALNLLDRQPDLKDHVVEMNSCSDEDLAGWIAGARALLMPSFAEGFGLPVIEAMQLGTPVITSDLPVFREFAGSNPLYLDPMDGPAWEAAVRSFVDDEGEANGQRKLTKDYRPPNWTDHFEIVEKWLDELISP